MGPRIALAALMLAMVAPRAAELDADQKAVWDVERQVWRMVKDKDLRWVDEYVHPRASFWTFDAEHPQDKPTLARLERDAAPESTTLEYELTPESVTVTGDVAVAHYRYRTVRENARHQRSTATGRYTDVFLREDGRWRYIAWAGGDDPKP